MEEISAGESPFLAPHGRRPDLLNVLLAAVTMIFLLGTAWIRFGPSPKSSPPAVGEDAPPIRLIDLESREPIVLLGLSGKVIWLTFWSARSPGDRAWFNGLERIRERFEGYRKFTMIAPAIEANGLEAVRGIVAANRGKLPVYLATPETGLAFGVEIESLPTHFVIDADGRILASSPGRPGNTLDELEEIVRSRLDVLEPEGGSRFADPASPASRSRLALSLVPQDVSVAIDNES